MKQFNDWLRLITGIGLGLLCRAMFPIYNRPFGACGISGFSSLEAGCSAWPDFLMGLSMVLVVGIVGPVRLKPQFWGLVLVIAEQLFLGDLGFMMGSFFVSSDQLLNAIETWLYSTTPSFLGGLLGCAIYSFEHRLSVKNS